MGTTKHILTSDGNFYTVDTDAELYHYGVKGMKWGVRKDRKRANKFDHRNELDTLVMRTKTGEELRLSREPTPPMARFIAKLSKRAQNTLRNSDELKITKDGKHIGELSLYKESKDSLNVVWVTIDEGYEGKGYGTSVMNGVVQYAKQTKCKQVTLEVPGISPNARHIYEKLGFRSTGETLGDDDDAWGGLTKMKLKL